MWCLWPSPQKAPAAVGEGVSNLTFGLQPLSPLPRLPPLPHLQEDAPLQDLNKIKTDSVEPCSGLSYKGFTQLSLSEFILSTPLSSSGCMLLISFKSLRRLGIKRGKCQTQLHMRTNRAQSRARAKCVNPGQGGGEEPWCCRKSQIHSRKGL